jgi:uncharacterized Zn-finger protein
VCTIRWFQYFWVPCPLQLILTKNINADETEKEKLEQLFLSLVVADVGRSPLHSHRRLWRCMQPRICPVCFKTFSTSFNLKQHIQNVHLPSQGIQCHLCRKCFKNKRYLRKHLVTYHGAPLRRVRTQDGHIVQLPKTCS